MKSRITIEVDYENGNQPVIQIIHKKSEDVRDGLLTAFLQSLQGTSSWLQIKWEHSHQDYQNSENNFSRILIRPIIPKELKDQSEIMANQAKLERINSTGILIP